MGDQPASTLPRIGAVTLPELWAVLKAGFHDFRRAPQFGLFFSAVYVISGLVLIRLGAGTVSWTLTLSLGFPLVAPFAAVGLYEVSRRLEDDEPLTWRAVLGVVWRERTRQVPMIGAVIVIYFLFWTFLAHMIFALMLGRSPFGLADGYAFLLTAQGLRLVAVEMAVGAVLAFLLFALTVVSLPLVLEREVDFVTAMLLSVAMVRENLFVMLVWAFVIAVLSVLALLPWFLGLFAVLPVLGHATWHLYRRALTDESA
jgi:uncharacterized membrane protein